MEHKDSTTLTAAPRGTGAKETEMNITTHTGKYQVEANGHVYGIYEADTAQAARDLCAVDAGYKSEADMVDQLEQASELIATEV